MAEEIKLQQITYYRQVRPPTLAQYLYRRAVKEAMEKVKDRKGVSLNPETGFLIPTSALAAKEMLKGLTTEQILAQHPEWKEDYERDARGE